MELTRIERDAQIKTMIEEMKRLSGEKREKKGRAILGLRGKIAGEEFGFKLVRYGRRREIETEISVGDEVIVSRGDPLKSDLRGVVAEKGSRYITVALETVPDWALKDVRVDLFASDLTFKRWIENLQNLNASGVRALKLALGIEEPLENSKIHFTPLDDKLNSAQREAVSLALGSPDFFLIHGPFGTGKTRTLAEVVRQLVKSGERVLVTAESNTAVDNLVEILSDLRIVRVGHPARVDHRLKTFTLSHQICSHTTYEEIKKLKMTVEKLEKDMDTLTKPVPALRRGMSDEEIFRLAREGRGLRGLSADKIISMARWIELRRELDKIYSKMREIEESIAKEIIENSEVVLATNSMAFVLDGNFDVVVIDEATQATIPSILIPISKARKFVLAGDHKQLPPTVLEARELSNTLFEMLIDRFPEKSRLLDVQYRMNERIMEFPSREFYGGRIKAHESVRKITLSDLINGRADWEVLDPAEPIVFVDTSDCPDRWESKLADSPSRYNRLECRIVERIVDGLVGMGVKEDWICVITPYEDQVDFLRRRVRVDVSTVDGFQGREREVVVISFVRSNRKREIGFLDDLRRLNVSITRAKRKLIMVGDSETLSSNDTYRRLIEYVRRRGIYSRIC
nr:IGHMBP2 family helicase [Archaeoglobus neptunius]